MTTRALVERWRRRLVLTLAVRSLFAAVAGAALTVAILRLAALSPAATATLAGTVALLVAGSMVARAAYRDLTAERTALWIEEREPRLRYALVSAVEQPVPLEPLERAARAIDWEPPARSAMLKSLRVPAAAAFIALAVFLLMPAAPWQRATGAASANAPGRSGLGAPQLGSFSVTVRPPSYARRPVTQLESPSLIRALAGSAIELAGVQASGSPGDMVRAELAGEDLAVISGDGSWRARFSFGAARALLRVARGSDARLIGLEPVVDSAPSVTLTTPARDTVLREPKGTLTLAAEAHDDFGLASALFEYIVSSGEGERFTFKSGTLGSQRPGGASAASLRATFSLEALALAPGDVVHLRAVARDANDVTGPGIGTSDARTIRIARAGEYDSVAVEAAAPSEADKSIISQRMLINMTEALVRRQRSLTRQALVSEAGRIARDQARLRRLVSDLVFSRLGSAGSGEESTEPDDSTRGNLTPEQLLALAEKATEISDEPLDFSEDESPVVAINRPLLEAYNAMWDAGRALSAGEPRRALPPMYVALAAIQKARAAERLYLRGTPPKVVVDLARVRLQAPERGVPGPRSPRAPLDDVRRAALARLARATTLLTSEPSGALDSLVVLRLAVVERSPAAADALEAAIDAVRTGQDATAPLVRARRALDSALAARDTIESWIAPR